MSLKANAHINVLLIEDNPDDALLIQEALGDIGSASFNLDWVARLAEGMERLAEGDFDVVLLDLSLPDSQGLDTFTTAHEGSPAVPIILLTGLDDERVAVQAVQLGAQDYLVKNHVDGPSLVRSVRYAIERQHLLAEVVTHTQELSRINSDLESEISERKRAEEALARQAEELARSNAELEQFAYAASHDLQEPLRMVTSYVQILQDDYKGKLSEDADRFIGYAVEGATRMKALIDDLLAFSRVGTETESHTQLDCNQILEQVLGDLDAVIVETGAVITHEHLPTVNGSPTQLAQLLQNLISNGMKFQGEKPPRVHVGVESNTGEWVFSVRDNGIGIPPHQFDRIFLMFQRLHHRSEYPGTGIGLALCQKIVQRHGGRIWVESELGLGSTFYFTIKEI